MLVWSQFKLVEWAKRPKNANCRGAAFGVYSLKTSQPFHFTTFYDFRSLPSFRFLIKIYVISSRNLGILFVLRRGAGDGSRRKKNSLWNYSEISLRRKKFTKRFRRKKDDEVVEKSFLAAMRNSNGAIFLETKSEEFSRDASFLVRNSIMS